MEDERVWQGVNHHFAIYFYSVVACTTLVVLDGFTSSQPFEAIEYTLLVFDFKREIEEWFIIFTNFATSFAYHDRACLTAKHILKQVLLWSSFDWKLQTVKNDIEELLGILLLSCVGRSVIEVLEGIAKLPWVVILSLWQLEETHQLHELVQHIVIQLLSFVNLNVIFDHLLGYW